MRGPAPEAPARTIAYFSMEVGIDSRLPIYAGGLGVLAGDTLRSFADLEIPAVAVSLLYRRGYFRQSLDRDGSQREHPVEWNPGDVVRPLSPTIDVTIEQRTVMVRAWEYTVMGATGFEVPLILLDTDVDPNLPRDRGMTSELYGGDERIRLAQEIVLGMGGVKMLRALGYAGIERFHMNEGHASLLAFELLREEPDQTAIARDITDVRARCVFTTHTPVAAGHDQFPYDLVKQVLGEPLPLDELQMLGGRERLNMTLLALNLSRYVNGVAKRHGVIAQHMFPGYAIDSITNGVHSLTWTSSPFRRLFDQYIPGWSRDPFSLRYAIKIPPDEIWAAHVEAKTILLADVERRTGKNLPADVFTIGFARRATAWKRPDLVLRDPARLRAIVGQAGPVQFLFAGKAHPQDEQGKEAIRHIVRLAADLEGAIRVVYLEDYDLELARLLTSGVDLWLNTPLRPFEASGTSGMKAAHNGVPSLSILDGWWIEGHLEGVTGWAIGAEQTSDAPESEVEGTRDAEDLYDKLARVILPLYYTDRSGWIAVMQRAVALNASFFNTHRMVQQYAANAYL